MFEVGLLLAQSNVVRNAGSGGRRRRMGPLIAWMLAALIASAYLGLAIAALKSPIPDEWVLVSGPTTWTGLSSMTVVIFVVAGLALSLVQWTSARGGVRRYRPRPRRPLQV